MSVPVPKGGSSDRDRSFLQPRVLVPFVLITLIWGSGWLAIKGQLTGVAPAWSVTYRLAIAVLAMLAYAAIRSELRIGREGHMLAMAFGIPQFFLNFNLIYLAERHITSGLVAVLFALLLVPNSILALIFLKHRVSRRFLLGSLVAVAGVGLLFAQELRASRLGTEPVLAGIGLTLLALLCVSIANTMLAAERLRAHSLPGLTAWGMFYGLAANALLAWAVYGPPTFDTGFVYVGGLLYLGLIGSAYSFTVYFTLIRRIGPARAAFSTLLVPIIAMALSTAVEGYLWSPVALVGGVLTLAGLFIALDARRSETGAARMVPAD